MTKSHSLTLIALLLGACGTETPAAPATATALQPEVQPAPKPLSGHVTVDNGWVVVHADQPVFQQACVELPKLEKQVDGKWLPLQDERPPSEQHPGYYLDETYVGAAGNEGCDVRGCVQVRDKWRVAPAAEFVRTGTRPDPTGKEVDRLEKRPLAVPVRAHVTLHRSARCDDAAELVTLNQPSN